MESNGAKGEQSFSAACSPSYVSSVFPPVVFPQALGSGAAESVPSLHSLQPVLGQPLLPSLASSTVASEPMVLVPASALAPDLASRLFPNVFRHKSQPLELSTGATTSVSIPTISSGMPNHGTQQYPELGSGAQQLNNLNIFSMASEPSDTKGTPVSERTNHLLGNPHHPQSVRNTSQTFCFSKSGTENVKEDALSSTRCKEPQFDAAPTNLKSLELSKILSSLPPGWRVVGLTNDVGDSATGSASGQTVSSTQGRAPSVKENDTQSLPVSREMFTDGPLHQVSSSTHHNTSRPESELYGPGKEVTQVDVAKIKTEIVEAWEADKEAHCGKGNRDNSGDLTQEKMEGASSLSKPEIGEKTLQPLSSPTGPVPVASPSLLADGQWTIVGITTLSTPFTNTTSISNPVAQPLLSTQQSPGQMVHEKSPSRKPGSPGSTILRVPSAPVRATTPRGSPKSPGTCSKNNSDLKLQDNDKTKAQTNSVMKKHNVVDCKPEEMKWTIVGVTVSPSINSNSVVQSSASGTQKDPSNQCLLDKLRFLSPSNSSPDQINSQQFFKPGISPVQMSSPEGLFPYNLSRSPLSAKPEPEVESNLQPLIPDTSEENQWKIVGITSLNTPAATPTILPLPLGTSSMGFLVPTANELVSKAVSTGSVITTSSDSFNVPVALNLSPKMAGEVKASAEKPADLPAQQSLSINELVQQHQQQNLLQALQSQLNPSVPNPKAVFEPQNQWNMVGVIANNQVSMFNQALNPPLQNLDNVESKSATSSLRTQEDPCADKVEKKDTISKPLSRHLLPKGGLSVREPSSSSGGRKPRVPKNHWTFHNYKPKKATVSNLLMMKRKKEKHGGEVQWDDSVKTMKMSHWLNSLRAGGSRTKQSSERSLRSFAGNRKVFSRFGKTSSHVSEEQRSLKSGTESLAVKSKGRCETLALGNVNGGEDGEKMVKKRCDEEKGEVQSFENDVKVEAQSAARKRKLKVPRKMVADMDYLPFDSSSDSN